MFSFPAHSILFQNTPVSSFRAASSSRRSRCDCGRLRRWVTRSVSTCWFGSRWAMASKLIIEPSGVHGEERRRAASCTGSAETGRPCRLHCTPDQRLCTSLSALQGHRKSVWERKKTIIFLGYKKWTSCAAENLWRKGHSMLLSTFTLITQISISVFRFIFSQPHSALSCC